MSKRKDSSSSSGVSRREFLKTSSSAALAGAILAPQILRAQAKAVSPGETLKVGLIGCGGRGTGAAAQALKADANVALVALGDVFERPLNSSIKAIAMTFPGRRCMPHKTQDEE